MTDIVIAKTGLEGENMTEPLDDFIEEIEREIHEETRKAYGKVAFER